MGGIGIDVEAGGPLLLSAGRLVAVGELVPFVWAAGEAVPAMAGWISF